MLAAKYSQCHPGVLICYGLWGPLELCDAKPPASPVDPYPSLNVGIASLPLRVPLLSLVPSWQLASLRWCNLWKTHKDTMILGPASSSSSSSIGSNHTAFPAIRNSKAFVRGKASRQEHEWHVQSPCPLAKVHSLTPRRKPTNAHSSTAWCRTSLPQYCYLRIACLNVTMALEAAIVCVLDNGSHLHAFETLVCENYIFPWLDGRGSNPSSDLPKSIKAKWQKGA